MICDFCQDSPATLLVAVERNFPADEDGPERDMPVQRAACQECAEEEDVDHVIKTLARPERLR